MGNRGPCLSSKGSLPRLRSASYPQQRTQEKARPYSLPGKAARQSAAEEALLFGKGERFGGIAPPGDSRGRAQANEGKQPVAVAADGQAHSDN